MAKKDLSKGINSTIGSISENANKIAEEELKSSNDAKEKALWLTTDITSSYKKGLKSDEIRMTTTVNEIYFNKIKAIAYWDRLQTKDLINQALEDFLKKYESENRTLSQFHKNNLAFRPKYKIGRINWVLTVFSKTFHICTKIFINHKTICQRKFTNTYY